MNEKKKKRRENRKILIIQARRNKKTKQKPKSKKKKKMSITKIKKGNINLKERDDHTNNGIRTESSGEDFVEPPLGKILLQDKSKLLEARVFSKLLADNFGRMDTIRCVEAIKKKDQKQLNY